MSKNILKKFLSVFLISLLSSLPVWSKTPETALKSQNKFVSKDCAKNPVDLLCEGYEAATLNHLPESETLLKEWLKAPTDQQRLPEVKVKLSTVLILQGKLAEGADIYNDLLKLKLPEDSRKNLQNAAKLFGAFKDLPVMKVVTSPDNIPLQWDNQGTPRVMLESESGKSVETLIDTGANLSTVSQSVAKKLDIKLLDVTIQTVDSVGQSVNANLALAPHLRMGKTDLYNIPFLVLADQAMNFKKDYPMDMILGLPVLLKLGRMEMYHDGHLIIGNTGSVANQNLFLDQFNLAVHTDLGTTPVDMMIDTGARRSHLGEGFQPLAGKIWDSLHPVKSKDTSGGVGGMVTLDVISLKGLNLSLAKETLSWKEIFLYPEQISKGRLQGVIGQDVLLKPGKGFVLDFNQMCLDWL